MINENHWNLETINWINPLTPEHERDFSVDRGGPVGLTTNQLSKRAGTRFQIIEFMSPQQFLTLADPTFNDESPAFNSLSFSWLTEQMETDRQFAPVQLWFTPWEFAHLPREPYNPQKQEALRKFRNGLELTRKDYDAIVKQHEGRHRAYVARNLAETTIPVSCWIDTVLD